MVSYGGGGFFDLCYEGIDVLLLSQETVDVNSQCAFALQHCSWQPHCTLTLNYPLQPLLQTRLVTKTAERGFDFTDSLEIGQRIDPACKVVREVDLAFDRARVAFAPHNLHRHPQLQRVEAARSHL